MANPFRGQAGLVYVPAVVGYIGVIAHCGELLIGGAGGKFINGELCCYFLRALVLTVGGKIWLIQTLGPCLVDFLAREGCRANDIQTYFLVLWCWRNDVLTTNR